MVFTITTKNLKELVSALPRISKDLDNQQPQTPAKLLSESLTSVSGEQIKTLAL